MWMRYFQCSILVEAVYVLKLYKAVFEQIKLFGIKFWGKINQKNKVKERGELKILRSLSLMIFLDFYF